MMDRLARLFRQYPQGIDGDALSPEIEAEAEDALRRGLIVERGAWASSAYVLTDAGREAFGIPIPAPRPLWKTLLGL